MRPIQEEIMIRAAQARVFATLAALDRYRDWLPMSSTYLGIESVSDQPVKQATTYVDRGTQLVFQGRIIEFEPHHRLAFEQTSAFMIVGFSQEVRIHAYLTVNAVNDGTHVLRQQTITLKGAVRMFSPLMRTMIVSENRRILRALKSYLEA